MKRKNLPPDGRLDWRDPNMPVYVRAIDPKGKVVITLFDPKTVNEYYQAKMESPFYSPPLWNNDPSYNWGKGKRNGRYK